MTSGPPGRRPPPCVLRSRRRASLPGDRGQNEIIEGPQIVLARLNDLEGGGRAKLCTRVRAKLCTRFPLKLSRLAWYPCS